MEDSTTAQPESFNFVTELYEGHPMLVIPVKNSQGKEAKFPVKMGAGKLRAVIDNIDYCKAWLAQQDKLKAAMPSTKGYTRSFKPKGNPNGTS